MKVWLALILAAAIASAVAAQDRLDFPETGTVQVIDGQITGGEFTDYLVTAAQSQILSVDLQSSGAAAVFNIQPQGNPVPLFVGTRDGDVADIPAPTDGTYLIRVYQMRAAAMHDETAVYTIGIGIGQPEFADSLFGGPDYWTVTGLRENSTLNLRAGPSTRYSVVGQLAAGTIMENQGCRLTGDMRWCRLRDPQTGTSGWAAGRYLAERTGPTP